jgi:hypothetical protein
VLSHDLGHCGSKYGRAALRMNVVFGRIVEDDVKRT